MELVENNVHVHVINASGHAGGVPVNPDSTCSGRGWIGNSIWATPLAFAEHRSNYRSQDGALHRANNGDSHVINYDVNA